MTRTFPRTTVPSYGRHSARVGCARLALMVVTAATLFCGGCDGAQPLPVIPPKFVAENVKTDHGVFTAVWYVTIRNDGGPGSMLVQRWLGSRKDPSSRKVIYSERVSLGAFQKTTVKIEWTHGGIGAIAGALFLGGSDDMEFLP
jgi:hypothetical protein